MNIVLICIDTLRFDCVGYQPDKKELREYNLEGLLKTPTLDGIAEKSLCFTNCFSTNTYTTAAHASVFTGLYPPRHGVRAFYNHKMDSGVKTLAETFREHGYETAMAIDVLELFDIPHIHER
jgi:arylsulfatase A-like enzyme